MTFDLPTLGFHRFFQQQVDEFGTPGQFVARIAAEHRGAFEVWSEAGSGWARLPGRLRRDLTDRESPAVGDWVLLDAPPGDDRPAIIQRLLQRRTAFVRGAAGRSARAQVVAANVDLVFAVCALDEDFSVRRIERYLARIRASGAEPVVLLTKADLADDVAARIAEVEVHAPGVPIVSVSALAGQGLDAVRSWLTPGVTAALVGSSGTGKSTLLNALLGEERMATGAVRERDGQGQHTTVHRQLVVLPGGGLLLDTPGMRELQLADEEGLGATFEDVEALAPGCRFSDCGHENEPGCAVRAAIAEGTLAQERLDHYLQLRREARSYERRHDARLRREDERAWGRLTSMAHRHIRSKRGE